MSKKNILNEIILAYRRAIDQRYTLEYLSKKYDIPSAFDETRIAQFKNYFLNYIYPHPQKREELDAAFQSLDNYIKHPEKLLRLLIDSASLVFKYGRHLPKILNAGIKALKSFRAASNFENQLVEEALESSLQPPYSQQDLETFLSALSKEDIERFTENNRALFETLHDRKLVAKIKEIVETLIKKMKKRPKVYSPEEVRGLEIGRDIIVSGDTLFEQLEEKEQRQILDLVIRVEKEVMYDLISGKN